MMVHSPSLYIPHVNTSYFPNQEIIRPRYGKSFVKLPRRHLPHHLQHFPKYSRCPLNSSFTFPTFLQTRKMSSEPAWKDIARRKQAERTSRIPSEWLLKSPPSSTTLDVRDIPRTSGILTSRELEITENHDATSLAEAIRFRKYTSEEVTIAFCKRAAIAQQLTNCLTEILFNDAIIRARYLDEVYTRTGKVVGPLYGVPISLKDTFKVKGYDASIGIASLAFSPATENSPLVDILLEQGAVLYCKTNIPQTLMALDSDNNVFGRTLNPRNRNVTAGGSSGGEGALIAMRGSVLGVGTDVGGSIRIPAMCNGLYGVKPSAQRIPFVGQVIGTRPGLSQVGLPASAGPLATSLRDCELFMQVISNARPWERDSSLAYGSWNEQGSIQQKPVIGIIRTDGNVTPLPPISNALEETAQTLRKAGVEVIDIPAPLFQNCQALTNAFFSIDGGAHIFSLLSQTSEPLIPWLSSRLKQRPAISLDKLLTLHAQKKELENEMLKIWEYKGRRIDAIICPVAPHPTPPLDRWNGVSYTSSFVLLDYPAGSLPVRDVREGDLEGEVEGDMLGNWDRINRELCKFSLLVLSLVHVMENERDVLTIMCDIGDKKTIDRNIYLNTNIPIQVVVPKLQERRLLQAMAFIDDILNKDSGADVKAKL